MNHKEVVKEQLAHLLLGVLFAVVIGVFAVALDLAAKYTHGMGVSEFTTGTLEFTGHALLVLDLVLFFSYVITAGIELVKRMSK